MKEQDRSAAQSQHQDVRMLELEEGDNYRALKIHLASSGIILILTALLFLFFFLSFLLDI
jgi:hypothetical protein